MRTTLTLDPDVSAKIKRSVAELRKPFKVVVNDLLRSGLEKNSKPKTKPYKTKSFGMGAPRPGYNLDNIAELIAQLEGEDYK
jgi:hypothetical protein